MTKHTLSFLITYIIFFTSANIRSQIVAYPDTSVCPGQPVTLYADAAEYCGACYTYHQIPYSIEPIGGTAFSMIDDTHTEPLDIGFTFCFFGEDYTQFYLGANGWISFEEPTEDMDVNWTPNNDIPDDSFDVPKNAIFGPWTDWNPGVCTDCLHYETAGISPYRRCIITYDSLPLFVCDDFEGTFQIVLYETTNTIENHFFQVDVCAEWDSGTAIQGLQNSTGTVAYTVTGRNATAWSAENESWRWYNSDIKWYMGASLIDSGDQVTVAPFVTTLYTVVQTLCDGTTYTDDVLVTTLTGSECDSLIPICDSIYYVETLELDTGSASIIWNSAAEAVSYIVQYKETSAITWNMFSLADTFALISGLEDCTNYTYRIGYICFSDTIFSAEITFTTDCIQYVGSVNYGLFAIAPNPAADHFIVQLNESTNAACLVTLYNTYGEKVLERKIAAGTVQIMISIDELPSGPYIVSLPGDVFSRSKLLMIKQ